MVNQTNVAHDEYHEAVRRVSWGAIFAGTVVAMVTEIVLTLLGLSIGLGVVSQAPTTNALSSVGIGAAIWLAVSTLISLFVGGYFAGRLAGMPTKPDGALNGVVVWGLATLLSIFLATSAIGGAVSGITGILGQGLQVATKSVTSVAPEAAEAVKQNPRQAKQEAQQALKQAKQQVQQVKRQAQQAMGQVQKEATQTARQAAPIAAGTALGGFISLVLGAIAAALGGVAGTPKDLVGARSARR
jgi:hypothetical protein